MQKIDRHQLVSLTELALFKPQDIMHQVTIKNILSNYIKLLQMALKDFANLKKLLSSLNLQVYSKCSIF